MCIRDRFKTVRDDLHRLWKVKSCIDTAARFNERTEEQKLQTVSYTHLDVYKRQVGKLCTTQHRINEDVVLSLVSEMLKAIAEYAKHDRAEFVRVVQEDVYKRQGLSCFRFGNSLLPARTNLPPAALFAAMTRCSTSGHFLFYERETEKESTR